MFIERKENKHCSNRRVEAGNVFLAIFGAIALVGLLGAAVMTFMKGPLATSVRLTKINTAENQMQIGSQVAVMATVNQSNSGDCDADGYVEPIEWRAATSEPHPVNGGLVPLSLGISKKDPWGTEYGYCVWNHGATTSGSGCNANMLGGTASTSYPVVALISAGPDKAFTTTCRDFATADVTGDGDLADATDLPLVSKAAETDDDIITSFTYQEATGASGGLWNLKTGAPETATIGKNIETTGSARLGGGLLLPDKSLITCDATTAGVMAMNGSAIEMCNGTSWVPITGGSSKLDDETVQTNPMCDSTATGQLRYNLNGGSGGISFVGLNSAIKPGTGSSSSLTLSIPAPAGISAGDVLLYAVNDGGCGTLTWPSGFTQLQRTNVSSPDGQCWAIAYKVATGSETTLDVNDSASWQLSGVVAAYSGVDTTSPIDASNQKDEANSSEPWAMLSNSLTTTSANTRIVWFGAADTDAAAAGYDGSSCTSSTTTFTPPSGFTKRADIQGLVNPYTCYTSLALADGLQATAGPTGALSGTLTSTGGGMAATGTMLVALKPASGGGGGGGGTAPAIVQSEPMAQICWGCGTPDISQSFSSAPVIGNSIVAMVSGMNNPGGCNIDNTTVTDTSGNTYTKAVSHRVGAYRMEDVAIWIAPVTTTAAGLTVTATASDCDLSFTLQIAEVSGVSTTSPVDVTAVDSATNSTDLTLTTSATSSANSIAFGIYSDNYGSGLTKSSDWSELYSGDPSRIYKVLSSAGTTSNTWSTSNQTDNKHAAIAVFKGVSSGGGSGTKTVEVCDGTSWTAVGSSGSSSPSTPTPSPVKLETETVNTDLMCDGTNLGLMRYNTAGTSTTDSVTLGGGGGVSPAIVQTAPISTGIFDNPPTVGNSIVVLVSGESGGDWWDVQSCDIAGATVTDNMGNVYTKVVASDSHDDGSGNNNSGIWIAPVANTGAGFAPSVVAKTYTGIDCGWVIPQFLELSGVNSSSPVDVSAAYSDSYWDASSLTVSTPSATTTNGLALGVFDHRTGFSSMATSSGWVALPKNPSLGDYNISKPVNATGVVSNTWTPDAHAQMSGAIAVFNGTSGGGGSTTTTVTDSTYAQVCNGTEWVSMGAGYIEHLHDVVINYTGTPSAGKQSTASMFLGKNVGTTAEPPAASNTAIGVSSMSALTTGGWNTSIGTGSLSANTTGDDNTAIGAEAMLSNISGVYNTAIGVQASAMNTTGYYNTVSGTQSFHDNVSGSNNVANGFQALSMNFDGIHNTANGYSALATNSSGWANVAEGSGALNANTTGTQVTASGYNALLQNTSGSSNVVIGSEALGLNTTGEGNTALGYQAGQAGTGNVTGNYNTFIGYQAQANADNYTNSTALGNGANITASNQIVLGNTSVTEIRAQVTSITAISDKRLKKDIEPSELGLFFIDSLRPVQYRYNNGDNTLRYGFIAQETESVLPDDLKPLVGKESGLALVNHDNDKDQTYHMTYGELTAPIVKAIQELNAKFKAFMTELEKTLAEILDHEEEQDNKLKNIRMDIDRLKKS